MVHDLYNGGAAVAPVEAAFPGVAVDGGEQGRIRLGGMLAAAASTCMSAGPQARCQPLHAAVALHLLMH